MHRFLWLLQIALAVACVSGGAFQIFKFDELRKGVAAMRGVSRGVWALLGAIGVVAGLGLVLPGALHWRPGLTAIAATVAAAENVLISGLYFRFGDRAPRPYSIMMAVMAAFIAYGRFVLQPL